MEPVCLTVPRTRQQITEGSIVILSRFPDKKWIVHYGWYEYEGQRFKGWYFNSIPENTQLPVTNSDLNTLTVVSSNGDSGCGCLPKPTPVGPGLTPQQVFELNRAWISVDTIAMRDELSESRLLPDGKIVRVNRVTEDGQSGYFIWNQVTEQWDNFEISAELEEKLARIESSQQWQSWPTIE